jgi:hypothetical protein
MTLSSIFLRIVALLWDGFAAVSPFLWKLRMERNNQKAYNTNKQVAIVSALLRISSVELMLTGKMLSVTVQSNQLPPRREREGRVSQNTAKAEEQCRAASITKRLKNVFYTHQRTS